MVDKKKDIENHYYVSEHFRNILNRFKNWCRSGEPPPLRQQPFLVLSLFFFVSSFVVSFICIPIKKSHVEMKNSKILAFCNIISMIVFFSTFCIGILSFCCWRRVAGFSWWALPFVNNV